MALTVTDPLEIVRKSLPLLEELGINLYLYVLDVEPDIQDNRLSNYELRKVLWRLGGHR